MIKDSGNRREFETGAVRDIVDGKGRCDLLPLDVVADTNWVPWARDIFDRINRFMETGEAGYLTLALDDFCINTFGDPTTMYLEVAKHFEEGANKYGERNWEKGIPAHCYIDSGVRHLLKFLRGDKDERHDRAFCWNMICGIWTLRHKPEMNDLPVKKD